MKRLVFLFFVLCIGCVRKEAVQIKVALTDGGRSVKFTGLDYAILAEITRDSSKEIWQALIPVYQMPADTDLKSYQPAQPGSYQLKDRSIVFTPDTPFVKGRAYFMRYYRFENDNSMIDYVRGRKKLGRVPYTDLVFQ